MSQALGALLNQLPEIQSEKERIQNHINIFIALHETIKQAQIDVFTEVENELMEKQSLSGDLREQVRRLLSSQASDQDKLRLILIYICVSTPKWKEIESFLTPLSLDWSFVKVLWQRKNPDLSTEAEDEGGFGMGLLRRGISNVTSLIQTGSVKGEVA